MQNWHGIDGRFAHTAFRSAQAEKYSVVMLQFSRVPSEVAAW
jgi:hypothetical protein